VAAPEAACSKNTNHPTSSFTYLLSIFAINRTPPDIPTTMRIPSTKYLDHTPTSALFNANMYSTPSKRYSSTPSSAPSSKARLKGAFKDNQWWCDCEPRLPAVRHRVRKNNKNRNRLFYTCQLGPDRKKQCGFFLWEDDAQVREKGALLNNSGTESAITTHIGPGPPPTPTLAQSSGRFAQPSLSTSTAIIDDDGSEISTGDELDMASLADNVSQTRRRLFSSNSTPKPQTADGQQANSAKRKRGGGLFVGDSDSEDDLFGGDLGSDEERSLVALTDSASQPRRKDSHLDQFATPSAQRMHDVPVGGLPTPVSRHTVGRNTLLIATEDREREAKRQKMSAPPTPSVGQTPSVMSGQGDGEDYDITQEVLGLLAGTSMTEGVRNGVRRTLNRYALKLKGVERGRDVVRLTVKAKDLKLAQLQEQVAMLESEKRADRERIEELVRSGSVEHTALKGFKDEFGYNHGSV
jgi:hypothetical protein